VLLSHVEFGYNKAPSKATRLCPFKVLYGIDPSGSLDLVPWPLDQKLSVDAQIRLDDKKDTRAIKGKD